MLGLLAIKPEHQHAIAGRGALQVRLLPWQRAAVPECMPSHLQSQESTCINYSVTSCFMNHAAGSEHGYVLLSCRV